MPSATFYKLRDEKQETIIRAAVHEFVEKGYTRARVSDIAAGAGVSKGSIFTYFGSKKELLLYCADWGIQLFMDKFDVGDLDVFDYFEDMNSKNDVMKEERELMVFYQVVLKDTELANESLPSMTDIGIGYVEKLIQNGKKRGTVRDDIPDDILIEFFLGITTAFDFRWMKLYLDFTQAAPPPEKQAALEREIGLMKELIRNGLGRRV